MVDAAGLLTDFEWLAAVFGEARTRDALDDGAAVLARGAGFAAAEPAPAGEPEAADFAGVFRATAPRVAGVRAVVARAVEVRAVAARGVGGFALDVRGFAAFAFGPTARAGLVVGVDVVGS